MKEIFLSFRPEYFEPILYGMKKYEYRKRFCNEETKAYLYLSGKERVVVGVMELGVPIRMDKTRNNYLDYPETLRRVDEYIIKRNINAVPIKALSLYEKPISLDEIRDVIDGFMPPQMYYVLDHHLDLKELLESRKLKERLFFHNHNQIYYDNLALSVSEMMATEDFLKARERYRKENN